MSSKFANAVKDVLEVMQFECWLRFYFIREEEGTLHIRVPEKAESLIKEQFPHLYGLVEILNNQPIDYDKSVATVCKYVVQTFDGVKYPVGTIGNVLDSKKFQVEIKLFNLWMQAHESQLDQGFVEFSKLLEIYKDWLATDQVKKLMQELSEMKMPTSQCSSNAIQ